MNKSKNIPAIVVATNESTGTTYPTELDATSNIYGYLRLASKGHVFNRTRDAVRAIERTSRDMETVPTFSYKVVPLSFTN